MAAGITIGTFTLAAGSTAGVLTSLGVSAPSSSVTILAPNDGTLVEVQTSAGTGSSFPAFTGQSFPVATELYLKNIGSGSIDVSAKVVTLS